MTIYLLYIYYTITQDSFCSYKSVLGSVSKAIGTFNIGEKAYQHEMNKLLGISQDEL